MNRLLLLPSAWLFDELAGDPEWLPHPVRLLGLAITRGEGAARRDDQSPMASFISGATLSLGIVASTYYISREMIRLAERSSPFLGNTLELLLAWNCLAARNLKQEATSVTDALAADDLTAARIRLSRIVGRDTDHLDASEISRAVIETLAESSSDGIIAPIFYLVVGGVPLALAYKAINTLDSMIGHADERYFYFGKFAARLDDIANLLPARLTALAIVTASCFNRQADAQAAWSTWHRDGGRHKSPNAGQPESAMAGALRIHLGGPNTYAGELIPAPTIGKEFPAPTLQEARKAIRFVAAITFIGVTAGMLLTLFNQPRIRRS